MKKTLLLLILFSVVGLNSCNEDNCPSTPKETSDVTFNVTARVPENTRVASIARYVLEIYKTSDLNRVVKRLEQSSGTFVVPLENNVSYISLFWADEVAPHDNIMGIYNATDLKNVTLNSGEKMGEAFSAKLDLVDRIKTYSVALERATAQINIIETSVVAANTDIEVIYDQYRSFNIYNSEVTGAKTSMTESFKPSTTTGTLGTFLTFASKKGLTTDFTTIYNSSVTNKIPNVAIKANYITNISGKYAIEPQDFTVVIVKDNNWKNEVDGVDINVGTEDSPKWIKVAERNAAKNAPQAGNTGNSNTYYGYYYQWSGAVNDPNNINKAYKACYSFGEGGGSWRLPTKAEALAIIGDGSGLDNTTRKLQWDDATEVWRLYDERVPNQKTKSVYFPLAGYNGALHGSNGSHDIGLYGFYWTSTPHDVDDTKAYFMFIVNTGWSLVRNDTMDFGFSVRCVKSL